MRTRTSASALQIRRDQSLRGLGSRIYGARSTSGGCEAFLEFRFDERPVDKTRRPKLPRAWRFDLAVPECRVWQKLHPHMSTETIKLAIEVDGYGAGHQSSKSMREDLEKYVEAFAQGWVVMRVSWKQVMDGTVDDALRRRGVRVGR